jgi:hypothetical protein
MSEIRIAVLVLLVGASVANFLAAKEQHDRIGYVPAPTARPGPTDPYGVSPPIVITPEPSAVEVYKDTLREHALTDDDAWLREAIIVTIAGIAWFAIGKKVIPN